MLCNKIISVGVHKAIIIAEKRSTLLTLGILGTTVGGGFYLFFLLLNIFFFELITLIFVNNNIKLFFFIELYTITYLSICATKSFIKKILKSLIQIKHININKIKESVYLSTVFNTLFKVKFSSLILSTSIFLIYLFFKFKINIFNFLNKYFLKNNENKHKIKLNSM